MKLFEIDNQLMECVDMETGEILDIEAFENLSLAREDKLTGIAKHIIHEEADIAGMEEVVKRIQDRITTIKRKNENTKNFLKERMEYYGLTKIEAPELVLTIPKPLPSLVGDDREMVVGLGIDVLELQLKEKKSIMAEIKKDIKEKLKNGETVDGYSLAYKTSLKIK